VEEEWNKAEGEHQGEEVGHFELAVVCFMHTDHKKLMERMRAEGFHPVLLHEVDARRHLVPERIQQALMQTDVACIAVPRDERLGAERFIEKWEAEQTERVGAISRNLGAAFLKSLMTAMAAVLLLGFLGMNPGTAALFSLLVWVGSFALLVPSEKPDEEKSIEDADVAEDTDEAFYFDSEHDEGDGHDEHSDGHT